MKMTGQECNFNCTKINHIISSNSNLIAFNQFKHFWNSTDNIEAILEENIFKMTIASAINAFENELIYNFVLEKGKEYFKDSYQNFSNSLDDYILKGAISGNYIKSIERFIHNNLPVEEGLQISIKYGAWESFNWFLDNQVVDKQKSKIIKWSQKEFWQYASNGYAHIEFIKKLIHHPLSNNPPIKQPIYDLINDCNFDFVNEFIQDEKCLLLLSEINKEHFYKLFFKSLSSKSNDEYYKKSALDLLTNVYQIFDFDLSQLSLGLKFKKENPDIVQMIDKLILKNKLDLLPEKKISLKSKI